MRLTRWLDRLGHFNVNIQYTAGTNIPLTDYLSRHPIVCCGEIEVESNANGQNEIECEEEFVVDQLYALFEFNQASGSTKRYIERTTPRQKTDSSQHGIHMRERNQKNPSLETFTLSVSVNSYEPKSNKLPPKSNVDKVSQKTGSFLRSISIMAGPKPNHKTSASENRWKTQR